MKKLSFTEFKNSLGSTDVPANLSRHEKALWFAGKAEWEKAHEIVQDLNDRYAAQIHAYLHRQEGDSANASYWYSKAGTAFPQSSLDIEWEDLVRLILGS